MSQLKPGTLLAGGQYRIIRTLGQGGFGITYEGEQVALKRRVAIKEFFMKDYCDRDASTSSVTVGSQGSRETVDAFRRKFIREAEIIAQLDNAPHVVPIHDRFEENGTAYYVMKYVDGESLRDYVKARGPLPEAEALGLIRQLGEALDYLHSNRIMHLDVKPANVLRQSNGQLVLIDFGISKHYAESGEATTTSPIAHSKGYAAIEQYKAGGVSQFSPATDIYSLGATLYFMLTATTPPEATDILDVDDLKRPASISNTSWTAIQQSMQPSFKRRPQNISAFMSLLGGAKPASALKDEATITVGTTTAKDDPTVVTTTQKPIKPKPVKPIVNPAPASNYETEMARLQAEKAKAEQKIKESSTLAEQKKALANQKEELRIAQMKANPNFKRNRILKAIAVAVCWLFPWALLIYYANEGKYIFKAPDFPHTLLLIVLLIFAGVGTRIISKSALRKKIRIFILVFGILSALGGLIWYTIGNDHKYYSYEGGQWLRRNLSGTEKYYKEMCQYKDYLMTWGYDGGYIYDYSGNQVGRWEEQPSIHIQGEYYGEARKLTLFSNDDPIYIAYSYEDDQWKEYNPDDVDETY